MALCTLLLTLMVSCVEADSTFGNSFIPPQWEMSTRLDSTIKVQTYTFASDSVLTSGSGTSSRLVGSFIDPLTGRTTTQVFSNYQPFGEEVQTSGTYFGKDPVADSVFLSLKFTGYRGDTTVATEFEVYEVLSGDYPYWKPFYSNFDMKPYIADKPLYTFTQKSPMSIKERLPIEFARKLMVNTQDDSNPYRVDSVFRKTFKGLYIKSNTVTSGEGCIYNLDLAGSGLTLHYHNNNPVKDTTTVSYLMFESTYAPYNTNFTTAQHDFSFADPSKGGVKVAQINDSTIQTELNYIQGIGGLGMAVKFPEEEIKRLLDQVKTTGYSKIAVQAAELRFTVEKPGWENYDKMFTELAPYFSLSRLSFTPDYQPLIQNFPSTVGGVLNRSLGTYTLNITSYIQGLLLGRITKHTLEIEAAMTQYLITNRSVLKGSASDTPPLLVLTYTLLK